jgi:hypothetical protein
MALSLGLSLAPDRSCSIGGALLKERSCPIYQGVPQDTRSPWQITASIVEVSLEPAPFGTGGLDGAGAGSAELL